MRARNSRSRPRRLLVRLLCVVGALGLTGGAFLVLPVIQAIASSPEADTLVRTIDSASLPPPPLMEEPQPEEEEPPQEAPPELVQDSQLMDLSQLELALQPSFGAGMGAGSFDFNLNGLMAGSEKVDEMISMADLDQAPRALFKAQPVITPALRSKMPCSVRLAFQVTPEGRVVDPRVISPTDPIFEAPATEALVKWRFEPGKRKGQPVSFRMRMTITFK